ncbi:DUF2972 domain-containing protein, partial [Campylobacter jejuni]
IEHRHNGGGYIALFKKLYKIKKQHKKEQKIYQQIIQVFPQLKYPSLETCLDYSEALRYKFHLSYILGEVLIKAYQNWYKGAGFKLKNNIKKADKEFQIFREILKEFKELNGEALKAIQDNKQLFLKEFPRIKNILKIHQNYQPIMNNIFHNFNYFIKNFDLIEEWLLSDKFKEKYKKENHPYPSLLDPKKLNDENEKINYHNISAELAWEMNLPLPENYEFIWLYHSGSGSGAMYKFFSLCEVNANAYAWESGIKMYKTMYCYMLTNTYSIAVAPTVVEDIFYNGKYMYRKLLYMITKDVPILWIARDPISVLKTGINHINVEKTYELSNINKARHFSSSLKSNFNFPKLYYGYSEDNKPSIYKFFLDLNNIHEQTCFTTQRRLELLKSNNYDCIEFNNINIKNAFNTFKILSKKYKFKCFEDQLAFQERIDHCDGSLLALPTVIDFHVNKDNIIKLIITKYNLSLTLNRNMVDITKEIIGQKNIMNIIILISKNDYKVAMYDKDVFNDIKKYVNNYILELENNELRIKNNAVTEKDILDFLKTNRTIRITLKQLIDENLKYVKKYHPEYLETWKYYQEFEKMCKELDENHVE